MSGDHIEPGEDISQYLHAVTIELEELESNLKVYLTDRETSQRQQNSRINKGIDAMKLELSALTESVHFIVGPFLQNMNDEVSTLNRLAQERDVKVSECRLECDALAKIIENQAEIIKKQEKQIEKLEMMMREQNSFLSSLGSTLAGLLWKVSKNREIPRILLESSKFVDLFGIIGDVLKSFFAVYDRKMPSTSSDEVQFIISLIGIIVNATALPEGRQFVIETQQGRDIVKHLLKYVSQFSDSNVQRLMLMAIFNISIHKHGTRLVLNERSLLTLLKKYLTGRCVAMKYVSLKLLLAIMYNTDDITHLSILFEEIPIVTFVKAEKMTSEEERDLVNRIRQRYFKLQNVHIAAGSREQ